MCQPCRQRALQCTAVPCGNVRAKPAGIRTVAHNAGQLNSTTGRKAIVALFDGLDTGSDVTLSRVIETAQSEGAVVHSARYSSPNAFFCRGRPTPNL